MAGNGQPDAEIVMIKLEGEQEACVLAAAVCALHAALAGHNGSANKDTARKAWCSIMRAASELDWQAVRRVHAMLHRALGDDQPPQHDSSSN